MKPGSTTSILEQRLTRLLEPGARTVPFAVQRRGFTAHHEPLADADNGIDRLTQLPCRELFLARLRRSIAPEWCVEGLFILLIDIDGFQEANERYGYDVADRILVEVGARLKRRLRDGDAVARFGPDEFAILLGAIRTGEDTTRVADRLRREVSLPFAVDGQDIRLSASVGVAMGMAGARPEQVVRDAESALARAKLLGRTADQAPLRDTGPREGTLQRLETALRRVLEQEEWRTLFRPTVLRKDGSVPGFEIVLFKRVAPMPPAPSPHPVVSIARRETA
jgi:diguanylate cyclase (GGDEF)-like protein